MIPRLAGRWLASCPVFGVLNGGETLRRNSIFMAALALSLAVLVSACQPEELEAVPGVAGARATPPPVTPTLPLAGETVAAPPQIIVSDQFVREDSIVVDQATVPEPGWVAIYDTLPDGAPRGVIGHARIGAQLNVQVLVQLERSFDSSTQLVAMLHRNTGDPESFNFPDEDPPFTENGRPVIDRFTVRPSQ
jgi:hypothetical protein